MEERPWLEKEAVVEEAPCWREEGGWMVERPWLEKEEVTCWREEGRGVEKATGAEWAAEDLSARLWRRVRMATRLRRMSPLERFNLVWSSENLVKIMTTLKINILAFKL